MGERCPTCGQPVRIVSSGEGTNSYAVPSSPPPPTAPEPLRTGERVEFGEPTDPWGRATVLSDEVPGQAVHVLLDGWRGEEAHVDRLILRRAGRESSDG